MGELLSIRVGDWIVAPALNQLERDGRSIHIEPRAMEVLVYLADHAGEVVSADELIAAIWGGRVVGDGSVYLTINHLRQAFRDDRDDVQYIQTIRKRGYRLVAPVTTLEPEPSEAASAMAVGQGKGRKLGLVIAGGTVLALAIGFLVFDRLFVEQARSIAVLPFSDMSPNGDQEYFADGIAEELLNELTRLDGLRVAGRTSSFSFKHRDEDLQAIGEALRVNSILEGSVRKDGDRVRIVAQLINTADGYHIWSETYDRELTNIFAIQQEIAVSVAGALGVRLGVGGVNAFRGAGTRNVEAYEAYLQGLQFYGGRATQAQTAIPLYEQAIRHDPDYAAAWAQLGLATGSTMWLARPEDAPAILERAHPFVFRAVELDPESALANSLLGTILYAQMDWIGGEEAHAKALSLLSDRPTLSQHANLLMRTGRTAAARTQYDAAEASEPLGGRPVQLRINVSLAQRQYAEAREIVEWGGTRQTKAKLNIALNEGDREEIKTAIRALPPTTISTTALYSPVLSKFDSPKLVLSTLRSVYADSNAQWPSKLHDIALLAAYFGDPEFALKSKAEEVRNTPVRLFALWFPIMSEVRKLPEFKELVTDLNLVAYWRAYGWADVCRPLGDDDFTCS